MLTSPAYPVPVLSKPRLDQGGALTAGEMVSIACTIARLSSVLCDLGGVAGSARADLIDQPYIWDIKEG